MLLYIWCDTSICGTNRALSASLVEQHVLAVLEQHRQPSARRAVVGENAVEERRAVAIDVQARDVVDAASDARARGVAVEVGARRRLPEMFRRARSWRPTRSP